MISNCVFMRSLNSGRQTSSLRSLSSLRQCYEDWPLRSHAEKPSSPRCSPTTFGKRYCDWPEGHSSCERRIRSDGGSCSGRLWTQWLWCFLVKTLPLLRQVLDNGDFQPLRSRCSSSEALDHPKGTILPWGRRIARASRQHHGQSLGSLLQ